MSRDDIINVDALLRFNSNSYYQVAEVASCVEEIFKDNYTYTKELLHKYIMKGFEERNFNILERFGRPKTVGRGKNKFYSIRDLYLKYGENAKAKEIGDLLEKVEREGYQDYVEGYDLYYGQNGKAIDVKAAAKKFMMAVCKYPQSSQPREMLAHCFSNEEKGIVTVKSVATWILNGILIPKDCKGAEKIDYLGETITAIDKHVLPTPVFFEHLAEDFAYRNKDSGIRKLDACTLYDFAKYTRPGTLIPNAFTMEKRAEYVKEYRKELEEVIKEMKAISAEMEEAEQIRADELKREQEKRRQDIAEAMAIISEIQQQKEAEEIAREIEEDLYDRVFRKW